MSQTPASEEPKAPRRRKSANPHGEVRILDKAEAAAQVEELRPAKVAAPAPVVEAPAPVVEAPAPVAPAPVVEAPAPVAPAIEAAPASSRGPAKGKKPVRAIPPPPGWVTARPAAPPAVVAEPAPKAAPVAPAPKPAAAPAAAPAKASSGGALFQVIVEGADSPVFVVAADAAGALTLLKGRFSASALAKAQAINVGDVL